MSDDVWEMYMGLIKRDFMNELLSDKTMDERLKPQEEMANKAVKVMYKLWDVVEQKMKSGEIPRPTHIPIGEWSATQPHDGIE